MPQTLPLLLPDLTILMKWLEKQLQTHPRGSKQWNQYLWFQAYLPTAFVLMARTQEVKKLKIDQWRQDVGRANRPGYHYDTIKWRFRKTNQDDLSKGECGHIDRNCATYRTKGFERAAKA